MKKVLAAIMCALAFQLVLAASPNNIHNDPFNGPLATLLAKLLR